MEADVPLGENWYYMKTINGLEHVQLDAVCSLLTIHYTIQ